MVFCAPCSCRGVCSTLRDDLIKKIFDFVARYMFHLIRKNRFKYLCMSDRDAKRRITFAFLAEAVQTFEERFGDRMEHANAYGMNADFAPALQDLMVCCW